MAVVAVDFPDQPFVITQPRLSDPFGNPRIDPVPRQDVARFYADFWGTPSALNHGHTVNEYWMEQTGGRVGVSRNASGVLSYRVAIRSLDGRGPQRRGVSLGAGVLRGSAPGGATCTFPLRNTGQAAGNGSGHPEDVRAFLTSDVYRLSATIDGTGYRVILPNALATARFGTTTGAVVHIAAGAGASPTATVTLRATSESDPSKTATAACAVAR